MGKIAQFRAAASALISRSNLANAAGITYEGARNLFKALGYKANLTADDYWSRYERNSVAARIIEAFPKGTWRGVGELIEIEDPDKITPFEKSWSDLETRLTLWPTFMAADILAGLGEYAVMVLGAPGNPASPLQEGVYTPEDLVYVHTYSQKEATVDSYEENFKDPRFGQPLIYNVTRNKKVGNSTKLITIDVKVHWTRVIHIPCDLILDDRTSGQPRLKRVWNLLDDLEKVTGAGSEAFWLRAHQGYHFDLDPELELDPQGEEEMSDEVDEFIHNQRRSVRTRGVKVTTLGSDVANFDNNVDAIISQISSGTSIPQRILMGSERGQLASQQDRVNWAERVTDRRSQFAEPVILRPFTDRCIKYGFVTKPAQYAARWAQIYDLSDKERADIAAKWAETNQKYKGVVFTDDEIRDRIQGFKPLTDVQRKKAVKDIKDAAPVKVGPEEEGAVPDKRPKPIADKV